MPTATEVSIDGRELAVGDHVRLRPTRRADAQDIFAAGRLARVERIERDVEGHTYLAVTLHDDPAAEHDVTPACPRCGTVALDRHGGDELVLEWIEYEGQAGMRAPDRSQHKGGWADVSRDPGSGGGIPRRDRPARQGRRHRSDTQHQRRGWCVTKA